MTDLTATMVRQSLDAFVNLDARQARRVCRMDDEVDRYNDEIIAELMELMRSSPEMVEPGVSLFSATRHLERIADHATNIAETWSTWWKARSSATAPPRSPTRKVSG